MNAVAQDSKTIFLTTMKQLITLLCTVLCMANAYAQETDYLPFVQQGKTWHVDALAMGGTYFDTPRVCSYWFDDEVFSVGGQQYFKLLKRIEDNVSEIGLFREDDKRVFLYDEKEGREHIAYDFNLKEGDEFRLGTQDYICKVKEVGWREVNGQRLRTIVFDAAIDAEEGGIQEMEWTECIGHSGTPERGFEPVPALNSYSTHVTYVISDDGGLYLPLSFSVPYNGWSGQQLITEHMSADTGGEECLEYEFVYAPSYDSYQLHIFGTMMTPDGPNCYIYCVEDVATHKITLRSEELSPRSGQEALHHVDLYFPFFISGVPYTIVDAKGEHTMLCSIGERHDDATQQSGLHDLSGRRLSTPPAKGLYIENGKVKGR